MTSYARARVAGGIEVTTSLTILIARIDLPAPTRSSAAVLQHRLLCRTVRAVFILLESAFKLLDWFIMVNSSHIRDTFLARRARFRWRRTV